MEALFFLFIVYETSYYPLVPCLVPLLSFSDLLKIKKPLPEIEFNLPEIETALPKIKTTLRKIEIDIYADTILISTVWSCFQAGRSRYQKAWSQVQVVLDFQKVGLYFQQVRKMFVTSNG